VITLLRWEVPEEAYSVVVSKTWTVIHVNNLTNGPLRKNSENPRGPVDKFVAGPQGSRAIIRRVTLRSGTYLSNQ
jgi:hypothetical protein